MEQDERHPIIAGLTALGVVGAILGLVVGIVAVAAAHVFGVGGGSASGGASLYLPPLPSLVAHSALPPASSEPAVAVPTGSASMSMATSITLTADHTAVAPMQQVNLTGSYTGADGEIVQVQEQSGGSWTDFPIPGMAVSGGRFATYIETGHTGTFRVIDKANGVTSNSVTITVS